MHSVLRDLTCTECSVPRIDVHFQCNAQCALALCVLLVPDFDGFVCRAAGEDVGLLGVERHATHIIAARKQQVRTKLSQKVFFGFKGMGRTCARSGATEISLRFVP